MEQDTDKGNGKFHAPGAWPGKNADAAPSKCIMRLPAHSLVGSSPQNPVGTKEPGIYSHLDELGAIPDLCLETLVPWNHLLATGTQTTEPGDSLPGWGRMAAPRSVSAAFQEYLQHLGLQDFPCGLGSWVRIWGDTALGGGTGLPLPLLSLCRTNRASMAAGTPGWRRLCHRERRAPRRCWSC